jgi:peptide/nickel transport system substrate-binding protein
VAACTAPAIEVPFPQGAADTPTPRPIVPTAPPSPKVLVVCVAEEPDTLYLYDSPNPSAQTLLPALYDGPFDVLGYEYRPVIMEATPSIEAGSVRLETISLASGDLYLNPESMLPEQLAPGKPYLPSGCTSPECVRKFEGGQAQLDRQVVDFTLLPDLVWSDGEPLTSRDSVFSFKLDADPDTPSLKDQVYRTASYEAVDERTVRWTGIPGYFDPEFAGDFWTPLPEHVLGGLVPAELLQAEAARAAPLGWGPYILDVWTPGESIEFVPNPNYHRRAEGLPAFDRLQVRFLGEGGKAALQQVLTGECDVLEEALLDESLLATLVQLSGDGRIQFLSTPGVLMERLDFGGVPVDGRPAILAEIEARRALASCIDRQGLIDLAAAGLVPVPSGMTPAGHPLSSSSAASISYSVASGNEALTSLGWVDDDADPGTPRVAQAVAGIDGGTALRLSLLTAPGAAEESLARAVAADLAQCGVEIAIEVVPAETLYAPWPDGPAFSRAFDLIVWPWLQWVGPTCELFTSAEIPSAENPEGSNASGFRNPAYDAACAQARLGPVAGAAYPEAVAGAQAILNEELPSFPLLQWPRVLVASRLVCGLEADPTASSLLWNVEEFTPGPGCEG